MSETVTTTKGEMEQLQTTLQKLQKQKESIESRKRVLEEEHQRILRKIEAQKNELEKFIFKLTGKKVQVVFTASS